MLVTVGSIAALALLAAACTSSESSSAESGASTLTCDGDCVADGTLSGDSLLVAVDREHALRADWAPSTLTLPAAFRTGAGSDLRSEVADAFVRMLNDAFKNGGVDMFCMSSS